ncbi:hypothetical protein LCGC14_0120230 [marine sediment metagenome]|uniref:Uncharacterized protein n=1 Tax=marine sediment metagenome TaxID=412755 RepID=A0A0F9XNQ3_9ZZZZ
MLGSFKRLCTVFVKKCYVGSHIDHFKQGVNETSMKYQKVEKQLDEREKLRKFRELDDAFAQALRQLDDPDSGFDIPTGPPVRSLATLEKDDVEAKQKEQQQEQDRLFKQRFEALLAEYGVGHYDLAELAETLLSYELWQLDTVPGEQQ